MASRWEDWLWQGKRDVEQARASAADGFFEWACFACQQGAEKALKAVYQKRGADAWEHLLAGLISELPKDIEVPPELADVARELDKHYIAPRYPNSLPRGAPGQSYTRTEAQRAIANAEMMIEFCESNLLR